MANMLEFIIRAKDATKAGISAARENFQGLANKVGGSIKSILTSAAGLVGITVSLGAVLTGFASAIKTAFEFERYESQFKFLMGDLKAAKQHVQDLQDVARGSISFESLASASRALMVLTNNALGGKESLMMLADVAQATGIDVAELGQNVGRAFAAITTGGDMGRALTQLEMSGAVSKETALKLKQMEEAGALASEMWAVLSGDLDRFKGAVDEASKTGEGLIDDLKDSWTEAVAEFGKSFMDLAKDGIGSLVEKLKQLKEDGTIAVWADRAKQAFDKVKESVGALVKMMQWIYEKSGASDAVAGLKGNAAAIGTLAGGGSLGEAAAARGKEKTKGFYGGKINAIAGDPFGYQSQIEVEDEATRQRETSIRAAAQARQKGSTSTSEKDRIAKALAEADAKRQKEVDPFAAFDKKAGPLEDAAFKTVQDQSEQAVKDRQLREKEKVKAQQAAVVAAGADADAMRPAIGAAEDRIAKAEAQVDQAWGWVKDPQSFRRQLKSEKENAKAQQKFEKDAERLQQQADWRTKRLSAKDEATRRMILAQEEKDKADAALNDIRKHVANLDQIKDDLKKALNAAGG